jgi:hypothetical protein
LQNGRKKIFITKQLLMGYLAIALKGFKLQ